MEKSLPQDIEAEQALLGSLLIDPDAIFEVADFVKAEHFYRDAHRTIYTLLRDFALVRHEPADFVTLCSALEHTGQLDHVGGASYVTSLINCTPTSAHAAHYGRLVEKMGILRALIFAAGRVAALCYEQVEGAVEKSEELILSLTRAASHTAFSRVADELPGYLARLDEMAKTGVHERGVLSGFPELDRITGGFLGGDLIILAARPSEGKTCLAQNIAYHACTRYGKRGAFFSLEMNTTSLLDRFVAMEASIDSQHLRTASLTDEEWTRLVGRDSAWVETDLYLTYVPGIDLVDLAAALRRLKAQKDIDFGVVDYLQLMVASVNGKRRDNRVQEVGEIAQGLKNLAGELDIPILAVAQVNREQDSRQPIQDRETGLMFKMPQLSDLRESGAIEQAADLVAFLARAQGRDQVVKMVLPKARYAERGMLDLYFEGKYQRFRPLAHEDLLT